ncbi:hypothetical protein HYT33_04430 [Candidatus Roizmanbacteria bacterium]|nr:hypothetical protein [Candidatus Roizmanbacteria bacterium]
MERERDFSKDRGYKVGIALFKTIFPTAVAFAADSERLEGVKNKYYKHFVLSTMLLSSTAEGAGITLFVQRFPRFSGLLVYGIAKVFSLAADVSIDLELRDQEKGEGT